MPVFPIELHRRDPPYEGTLVWTEYRLPFPRRATPRSVDRIRVRSTDPTPKYEYRNWVFDALSHGDTYDLRFQHDFDPLLRRLRPDPNAAYADMFCSVIEESFLPRPAKEQRADVRYSAARTAALTARVLCFPDEEEKTWEGRLVLRRDECRPLALAGLVQSFLNHGCMYTDARNLRVEMHYLEWPVREMPLLIS